MEKFVELGGGVDGKFVIVPTAGGNLAKKLERLLVIGLLGWFNGGRQWAVLRPRRGRRLQHEDAQGREIRRRDVARTTGRRRGRRA